jgi:hypothetical protein
MILLVTVSCNHQKKSIVADLNQKEIAKKRIEIAL